MKLETAESLAAALKYLGGQSLVCHNLPLGEDGYYVLSSQENHPIEKMHRGDCDEISDEAEAVKFLTL